MRGVKGVAEVLRFGFASWLACRRGIFRPKSAAILLVLGSTLLIPRVSFAAQSGQSPQAKKPSPSVSNLPAAEPATPAPPAPVVLPPTQNPSHPPVISWDGKLLTIDAENSSLADVLLGIRSRTGASIEMPGSTRGERIAIHLGPAPIREVLSSLLYGTDFNYVIQSAEDDETALGKVILTSRSDDKSSDDTVAGNTGTDRKVRLMPGYAAPGKRDFEVAHSNARDDSSSTAAETPTAEETSVEQTTAETDPAATNPQADTQPATAADATDPNAPTGATLTAAEQPGTVPANGSSGASSGGGTTLSQMEQNMQRLYQQRQQLQAQQGRAAQTPAP